MAAKRRRARKPKKRARKGPKRKLSVRVLSKRVGKIETRLRRSKKLLASAKRRAR